MEGEETDVKGEEVLQTFHWNLDGHGGFLTRYTQSESGETTGVTGVEVLLPQLDDPKVIPLW